MRHFLKNLAGVAIVSVFVMSCHSAFAMDSLDKDAVIFDVHGLSYDQRNLPK